MSVDATYNPNDQANLPPGIIPTRAMMEGIMAAFIAGGRVPLTQAQYLAITGPAPALVTSLPDWSDDRRPLVYGKVTT